MNLKGLKEYSLTDVTLENKYMMNAQQKEVEYLTSLDPERMIAGFRENAGLPLNGHERYGGWENMLIAGHTFGHYAAACVKSYETVNTTPRQQRKLLDILKTMIYGLKECQDAIGTGFIFAGSILDKNNVEIQFDNIEKGKTHIITEAWVPWYTAHKIFEGLIAVARLNDNTDETEELKAAALKIASDFADWTWKRVSSWDEKTHATVLGIEYGGMNDCLYELYKLTGKEEHKLAAEAFTDTNFFRKIAAAAPGDDILNNHHANTTIPKFMGALNRYTVTGEQEYLDYVVAFWNMVTAHHTYITGGNSEWEHFGKDDVLDAERTNANCETCNVYNMLKITKLLFEITGEAKYADWYEGTFVNSILSSQNPETGMTTYFQPMATGYFKVYGEPETKFWCCTGTGMENFSKLGESLYFRADDGIVINQYFSSTLDAGSTNMKLVSNIPEDDEVTVTFDTGYDGKLLFRLPAWLAAPAIIKVDGIACGYKTIGSDENGKGGFALIDGNFTDEAVITVKLPMKIVPYNMPDGEGTYGFKYGPVVLSALLGTADMITSTTGVDVTIPAEKELSAMSSKNDHIVISEGSVEEFMADINDRMVRDEASDILKFKLTGTDNELTFVTHYMQHRERYGIYFRFEDKKTAAEHTSVKVSRHEWLGDIKIDTVQAGYGQYESDELHDMLEGGTGSIGTTEGGTSRSARNGGAFSYRMLVDEAGTALLITLKKAEAGRSLRVCAATSQSLAAGASMAEDEVIVLAGKINANGGFDIVSGACEVISSDKEFLELMVQLPESVAASAEDVATELGSGKAVRFKFTAASAGDDAASVCEFIYTIRKPYEEEIEVTDTPAYLTASEDSFDKEPEDESAERPEEKSENESVAGPEEKSENESVAGPEGKSENESVAEPEGKSVPSIAGKTIRKKSVGKKLAVAAVAAVGVLAYVIKKRRK